MKGKCSVTQRMRVLALKKRLERKRGCKLNPPLTLEILHALENQYQFTLPEDFLLFLTLAGNGGTLPPITDDCDQLLPFPIETDALERLGRPFALHDTWMWEQDPDFDPFDAERSDERYIGAYNGNGFITLMEDECCGNEAWLLVVTGPCQGEVWTRSEMGIQRLKGCSFLDWLELHLSKKLIKYVEMCMDRESFNQGELDSIQRLKKPAKRITKHGFQWNPPTSITTVRQFESEHEILLPNEYVQFITQIANGGKSNVWSMYSLEDFEGLTGLSEPFPFQTKDDLGKIPINKYCDIWGESVWDDWSGYLPDIKMPEQAHQIWYKKEYSVLRGALPVIFFQNDPPPFRAAYSQNILILNGEFRGEVWGLLSHCYLPNVSRDFLQFMQFTLG